MLSLYFTVSRHILQILSELKKYMTEAGESIHFWKVLCICSSEVLISRRAEQHSKSRHFPIKKNVPKFPKIALEPPGIPQNRLTINFQTFLNVFCKFQTIASYIPISTEHLQNLRIFPFINGKFITSKRFTLISHKHYCSKLKTGVIFF